METQTYTAFLGPRQIAAGGLPDVLPALKLRFDKDPTTLMLVFDDLTGRQVDFDLRGTLSEVLQREVPAPSGGVGRPRLGVTSREISMLPRHWRWLEQQPSGCSGALRRLVELAIASQPGRERARLVRAALAGFLSAMAGDRPHYEEACRALFAGDQARFEALIARWPVDIRAYALRRSAEAARAEVEPAPTREATLIHGLYGRIWSEGELSAIPALVAPSYTVHADPGDPWEGQTLDHATYTRRVRYSRDAFPDLVFRVQELVPTSERVAVRWSAEGTHRGDLVGLPATGRRLRFSGQTIYAITEGRVSGHWQVVDRLGFVEQLRGAPSGPSMA